MADTTRTELRPGAGVVSDTEALRRQIKALRDTLEAIRRGGVDAVITGTAGREELYTLTSAERPYRILIENMGEGAATVSANGIVLYVNPCLGRMIGRDPDKLPGTFISEVFEDFDRERIATLLSTGPGEQRRAEAWLTGRHGPLPVMVSTSGLDIEGTVIQCLAISDLSIQKRAEERLEQRVAQRTEDLERANERLEAFSYSVSHDLRAPLRALSGFSQALVEDFGDRLEAGGRDYALRIQAAATRMSQLIDDLLHLSRAGRADMIRVPVDLSAEVRKIADGLRSADPARDVVFTVQEGLVAVADHDLIRTVLESLLGNAWKFTLDRAPARVEFGGRKDGTETAYYVRDNGVGFDMARADGLFQPFQRLHPDEKFAGSGLGLASVRRIVERHGGRTWAEGAVGRGATFYFTLGNEGTP